MLFLSSIFAFSILAALFMIVFRLRQLETGKVPFPDRHQFSKQFQIFAIWEKKMWEEGKRFTLRTSASSLKYIVSGIDKARKFMRKLILRMEEALVKKRVEGSQRQGASSFFLKDIAEHKKRMKIKK